MDEDSEKDYQTYPCFWGKDPGSYVKKMAATVDDIRGWNILDAGCGEGKNSAFLADLGARVIAVDISPAALTNARQVWGAVSNITLVEADITQLRFAANSFDAVVAYNILHYLSSKDQVAALIEKFWSWLKVGGYLVFAVFNDREHDVLEAHPNFSRLLLPHHVYLELFSGFEIISATDEDLRETHPTNNIPHSHSMTRVLARKR